MLQNVTKQRICEIFQSVKSLEIALLFSDSEKSSVSHFYQAKIVCVVTRFITLSDGLCNT